MFYIDFCIIYGTNRDSSDTDRSVPSVEGLVRRIIGSLQQQQAQIPQQPQSAEEELNRRFNIPRGGPSNPVGVAGGQSAPSSQVASVHYPAKIPKVMR